MASFDEVQDRLDAMDAFVAGGQHEGLVEAAEDKLGVKFPTTFREYLLRWGNVSFDSVEYYGLTLNPDFDNAGVPNCVWFTLRKRQDVGLPNNLVVFRNNNDEEYICVETKKREDERIVFWDNINRVISQKLEMTFLDFFLEELEEM